MSSTVRFGVSMDRELVDALDQLTETYNFPNRSQTLRHMVHEKVREFGESDDLSEVTAVVSLMYKSGTTLNRVPIDTFPSLSIHTNLQSHISKGIVLKILIVKGLSGEVRKWASQVMKSPHVVGNISVVAIESMVEELNW